MSMILLKRACLLAAVMAPCLVLAEEPAPPAQSLATVEAILEHCAKINPAAADQFKQQAKLLAQGASEETLAKVRKSEEYQQSREATLESLAKVDDVNAKKVCAQGLGPTR